jgi:hypothetical protein
VAFQGREIGYDERFDVTAYLTPKGSIVVTDPEHERLYVYHDYAAFKLDCDNPGSVLMPQVADSLGETYVRELDI